VSPILVTCGQSIVGYDLIVQSRTDVGSRARHCDGCAKKRWIQARVQHYHAHDRLIVDIPALRVEEEGSFLTQRTAYANAVLCRIVSRLLAEEGIHRVESR